MNSHNGRHTEEKMCAFEDVICYELTNIGVWIYTMCELSSVHPHASHKTTNYLL